MKTTGFLSVALLTLLRVSAAHPQGTRNVKRTVVEPGNPIFTEPSLREPTEVPQVVVYVNEEGSPLDTATETVRLVPASKVLDPASKPLKMDSRSAGIASRATYAQPYSNYFLISSSSLPASNTPSSASPQSLLPSSTAFSLSPSASASASSTLYGVAYAPYTAAGDCKTAAQVEGDFEVLTGTYSVVRIYGTDCNQVENAWPAAKKTGLRLFLGIFNIGSITQEVQKIVLAVNGDWSLIDTVSVGNELVNNGKASAQQVITAMGQARELLRAAGYNGPVVTVDTFAAVMANPSLCDLSDYCALNIHPFFDSKTPAEEAGSFVSRMVGMVQAKLTDRSKRIVCTETGWPWQGNNNGVAVPGIEEQRFAIDSIKEAYASHPGDVILFSAFNDLWKLSESGTFHAEQYWGIGGLYSDSDK